MILLRVKKIDLMIVIMIVKEINEILCKLFVIENFSVIKLEMNNYLIEIVCYFIDFFFW